MDRITRILADDPRTAEARAEIRRRPVVAQFAKQVAMWERRADQAWERGDLEWAAASQERAAIGAHRLGLLEDTPLDTYVGRRAEDGDLSV